MKSWISKIIFSSIIICVFSKIDEAIASDVDWNKGSCHWNYIDSMNLNKETGIKMNNSGIYALKECSFSGMEEPVYFSASETKRSKMGVCYYHLNQIFGWSKGQRAIYTKPQDWLYALPYGLYMSRKQGKCPKQEDPSYISTTGISDGLFLFLTNEIDCILEKSAKLECSNHQKSNMATKMKKIVNENKYSHISSIDFGLDPLNEIEDEGYRIVVTMLNYRNPTRKFTASFDIIDGRIKLISCREVDELMDFTIK